MTGGKGRNLEGVKTLTDAKLMRIIMKRKPCDTGVDNVIRISRMRRKNIKKYPIIMLLWIT